MARGIGDYGGTRLTIGDPELLFEVEDERWRESYRQLIENIQVLLQKIENQELRIRKLEAQ